MAGIIKVDRVQSDSNLAFNIAGANVAFMDASALRLVGSGITANGTTIVSGGRVVTAAQPTGSVLQVVQTVKTSIFSMSSTSWTAVTGYSATITPTSSTSKIYAIFSPHFYFGSANSIDGGLRIDRNGTTIFTSSIMNNVSAITMLGGSVPITYLESPATTSALTYTLQFNCGFANSPYQYPTIS